MPDDLESIGGLSVTISGDYSQLMSDLQTSQDLAANAGTEIAAGLEEGASGAASLTQAADELANSWQDTGDVAHYAAQSAEELGKGVEEAGEKAHESEGLFSELSEKIIDLATEMGIVVGAGELIKETFSAFSTFESASVALTALTGSADTAREQIEMLEQLAQNENLSFPALLEANQRMVAFGFSAEDVPAALQAAADAAAALNTDISTTSNAIDRLSVSGMAGARQLVQLGLTTSDLARIMGVTEGEVKQAFAALDQETRLEVVTAALDKFAGQAQVAADTLKGQWQGVKNTFEGFFVTLGSFLEPAAKQILEWFQAIGKAAEVFVLAIQINLEKLAYYFEKFTGQAEAANAKALEINANAEKFRALVSGATGIGGGAGGETAKAGEDLAALQQKIRSELQATWVDTDKVKAITHDYGGELQFQADLYQQAIGRLKEYDKELAQFGDLIGAQEIGLSRAEVEQLRLNDAQLETERGIKAIQASIPPVIDDLGNLSQTGERTTTTWKELLKQTDDFNKALDGMEGKIRPPFDALHEELAKIDKDYETGALSRIPQVIKQLAVDNLPEAINQQERFIGALEGTHASMQKLVDAHKQLLSLQMQLATESHNLFGITMFSGLQAIDNELGRVGNQIAKTALETRNWGQLGHQILTQLGEDIIGNVLNAFAKMAEKFLLDQVTQRAETSITNVSAVTSEAAVAAANAFASTAAIPIIGPALAPAAAAEAEGFVMGLVPQAAFEMGGYVPETMLALVHKGEYVVPAKDVQAAGGGQGSLAPGGISINIGQLHGVTRDTADHIAGLIVRKARLAGAFR